MKPGFGTLIDLLRSRSVHQADRTAYIFLTDGESRAVPVTYGELDRQARAIGAHLQREGLAGERALLLYPAGLEFIAGFFGCLYAGVIAVPVYPPKMNRPDPRLAAIVGSATPRIALTTAAIRDRLQAKEAAGGLRDLGQLATDAVEPAEAEDWRPPDVGPADVAFLQYTSGSTGIPRGVMVSHANILANQAQIERTFGHSADSTVVSWLPRYHDTGLIGDTFQPLYQGALSIFMSPVAFLQEPVRWLRAISRYRAHTSGAPNFAYELCVRQVTPEQRAGLDLSSWKVAYNGAEPVQAETLDRFAETFAACGFRREAFDPCYGLAEATLIVTGSMKDTGPRSLVVDAGALGDGRFAVAPESAASRTLVSCGRPMPGTTVGIVDPHDLAPCPDGRVGEIWVSGGSVAQGYWGRPHDTLATFGARLEDHPGQTFLRTGDLGFMHAGELYVTGRLKDLIISRGRNYYPQDIELSVEGSHPALRSGASAAFSVEPGSTRSAGDEEGERLVVVAEVGRRWAANPPIDAIAEAVCAAVGHDHELPVHDVVLLKPGGLPKTSSGKLRRHACRAGFLDDSLPVVGRWTAPRRIAGPEARPLPTAGASTGEIGDWLRHWIAHEAGLEADAVDTAQAFFVYGLDSVRLTRMAYELEVALGRPLATALLWETPTIDAFAREAAEAQMADARPPGAPVAGGLAATGATPAEPRQAEVVTPPDAFPLSPGQAALWFLHGLAPGTEAYNLVAAVRLRPAPHAGALGRAFEALVARHDALRTSYLEVDGRPVQRVQPVGASPFDVIDAAGWGRLEVDARLREEARRPFDLEHGPVARAVLLALDRREAVLLLAMHHIAGDYASLVVLFSELGALYRAETAHRQADLPKPALTYRDHVMLQAESLAGPRGERLWDYWRRELAGDLPVLDLPADHARPPVRTFRGASLALAVESGLTHRLRDLARARGVSLYMLLLAAFQLLLWRYSGQEDFLIGSLTAGRTRRDLSRLVGYLVNPVVLRADLSGDPTLAECLSRVRRTVLGALAHQDEPFATLVERLRPPRDPSRSALFDVLFSLHQPHQLGTDTDLSELLAPGPGAPVVEWAGLCLEPVHLPQQEGQFDLSLELVEGGATLGGSIKYDPAIFAPDRIERMAGHFQVLLAAMAARPDARISDLSCLDEAERHRLVVEWNATREPVASEATLPRLLAAVAWRFADSVAVEMEGEQLTYRELHERAGRLARRLRRLGVGPDVLVGLCLERSLEMVVGLLGIVLAGGAYVPLDPAWPAQRLDWLLADTGVGIVVTQRRAWAGRGAAGPARPLFLDPEAANVVGGAGAGAPTDPAPGLTPEHLAYTIYTSGSTGRPKGVQVPQRALVNLLAAMRERPGLSPDDVLLAVTPITFDIAGLEILLPWTVGARVVLASRAVAADGERLAAELRRSGATLMQATPATWRLLVESGWPGDQRLTCLSGGEALDRDLADRLLERGGAIWNMYGPTETTIWSTLARVRPGDPITLGRPIANTTLYVLDGRHDLVPAGVPGDLYIGGTGLARGYLNRPDLDAEAFLPDPFGGEPGGRLYRTGDVVRYRPDATLEYLGRSDHQVKVRGVRIEPGEVEAALREHPAVADAVVVLHTPRRDDARLVAYLVPASLPAPEPAELRRFLAARLPEPMLPSAWMILPALPRTPHGKVDRRALPAPDGASVGAQVRPSAAAPPRSATEAVVTAIWQELLGVRRVDPLDNFFELGGHSLLLVRVRDRLQEEVGHSIPIVDLFQYPTIRSLAEHLDTAPRPADGTLDASAIEGEDAPGSGSGAGRAGLRLAQRPAATQRRELRQRHRAGGQP